MHKRCFIPYFLYPLNWERFKTVLMSFISGHELYRVRKELMITLQRTTIAGILASTFFCTSQFII